MAVYQQKRDSCLKVRQAQKKKENRFSLLLSTLVAVVSTGAQRQLSYHRFPWVWQLKLLLLLALRIPLILCCSTQSLSINRKHVGFNSLPPGNFFPAFLLPADFFQSQTFLKNSFRNTIRVSNSLDPDQAQHFVGPDLGPNGPDLGPNCLQKLSADDTWRQRVHLNNSDR